MAITEFTPTIKNEEEALVADAVAARISTEKHTFVLRKILNLKNEQNQTLPNSYMLDFAFV